MTEPAAVASAASRRRLALAALLAFAALLRVVAWQRSQAIFDDGPVFLYLADAWRDGDWVAALRHPYHPGYPLAIAALGAVFPTLESAAAAVSIAAGVAAVAAIYVLVRDMFDEPAGWVAAALLAMHPPSVAYASDVQSDALYTALFLASAAAAWRGLRGASFRWAVAAGALAGGAYLVRPEGLGIALAGIAGGAWLGLVGSWGRRGALAWCAAFALAAACAAGPYVVALRAVTGEWALTQKKSVAELAGVDVDAEHAANAAGALRAERAIPRNGPLPGSDLAALAVEPARPSERIGAAVSELYTAAVSALRIELIGLLAVGLLAVRGRPGRRALFVGVATALYGSVLLALGATAGYVSRRHALPPLLLSFGYLAVGARELGRLALAGLARIRPLPHLLRARHAGAALALALVAAFFVPRDLAPRRSDRVAERRAAEWLAAHAPAPRPAVAARRLREAWYAGARFVPIPVEGYAAPALLDHLRARGARYVVVDEDRIDDHAGLREAMRLGMRRLHGVEAGGRRAAVLEIVPAGASDPLPEGGADAVQSGGEARALSAQ